MTSYRVRIGPDQATRATRADLGYRREPMKAYFHYTTFYFSTHTSYLVFKDPSEWLVRLLLVCMRCAIQLFPESISAVMLEHNFWPSTHMDNFHDYLGVAYRTAYELMKHTFRYQIFVCLLTIPT